MMRKRNLEQAYRLARERYAALGVDTETIRRQLAQVPLSLHCWQGDDVGGFEHAGAELSGGLVATGCLSGQSADAGRTARRCRSGVGPDPGPPSFQSARFLR